MHVDHELVDFMPVGEPEYDEVIEEYEEKILMQEGAQEPIGANLTDPAPAQGKPRCITLRCAFRLQAFYGNYLHKHTTHESY